MKVTKSRILAVSFSLVSLICSHFAASAHASDALVEALSDRHHVPSFEELVQLVGGRDQLIDRLVELRGNTTVPQVGMRSARLLLENYNGESEIESALSEDLERADRKGIAQMIALNLDKVPSSVARVRLAENVLQKAQGDSDYAPFAKSLSVSKDEAVRKLARQILP